MNERPNIFLEKRMAQVRDKKFKGGNKMKKKGGIWKKILMLLIVKAVIFSGLMYFILNSKTDISESVSVELEKGMGASVLAKKLKDQNLISSENIFKILLKINKADTSMHAGVYKIEPESTMLDIAKIFKEKKVVDNSISFTLFEGYPNHKIAPLLEKKMAEAGNTDFSAETFIEKARLKEGFLYPDTYKINPEWTEDQVIDLFYQNYKNKIKQYLPFFEEDLLKQGKTERDIVIMASIIEAEAGNVSQIDRQMVSGVLWNRIDIDMPLQADAVFSYIKQEHIGKVLYSDLKVESEYNVYKNKGLPPGPIGNPGLASIRASLNPETTDYLYYLTDKNLNFHYAISYGRHLENQRKYITNAQ